MEEISSHRDIGNEFQEQALRQLPYTWWSRRSRRRISDDSPIEGFSHVEIEARPFFEYEPQRAESIERFQTCPNPRPLCFQEVFGNYRLKRIFTPATSSIDVGYEGEQGLGPVL